MKKNKVLSMLSMILSLLIGASACSKHDNPEEHSANDSNTTAVSVALPTNDDIKKMLDKSLASSIPAKDKTILVQDSEKDPTIFDKLVEFKRNVPNFQYELGQLTQLSANEVAVLVTFYPDGLANSQNQIQQNVKLIYENNHWKLAKDIVCKLLQQANPPIQSAIC